MKVIIKKNYDEVSDEAFKVIESIVKSNPNAVLGLATGSSPIGLYNNMIKDHKENGTSYKNIKTVNLDEYIGLDKSSDQSYVYFMHHNLFDGLDINEENINIPNGAIEDMQAECDRYNKVLAGLKQDVQVLGIGANGHIGFNEPGTSFDSLTHTIELKEKTRLDNARFFSSLDEVPTHAVTMGIKNIMDAKQILIIATGENKAIAVKGMIEDPVSESCPASVLQKHDNVVVIIDEAAASLLKKKY